MSDLLARANQLEQDAPTLYVPENDSECNESEGSPYPKPKAGEMSPVPKTFTDMYSPEVLKHSPGRAKAQNLPFRLNLIDLPLQQDSQTIMSAGVESLA